MKPPEDVKPSELFLKLCEPEPSEEVDFPRYDQHGVPIGKLRIRVLSQEDHDRARTDGERELIRKGVKPDELNWPATREVLGDTIARNVLAMACLTAEKQLDDEHGNPVYGRVFRDAKDLSKLRPDEIAVLFSYYQLVQAKFGPYESNVSKEDVDAWVARLALGAGELPFLHHPLPQILRLLSLSLERIFSLYRLLDSQRPNLPPSLASDLDAFCSATGLFGEHVASADATGGAGSTIDVPVTIAQATALAHDIRGE